jgi:hypothetical protein
MIVSNKASTQGCPGFDDVILKVDGECCRIELKRMISRLYVKKRGGRRE